MKIQQIRNATLKIQYSSITILLDPWLQDRGTGPSFTLVRGKMIGMKNPLNDLPLPPNKILNGVDFCLVTHIHPDHFTADYLPQDIPVMVQNEEDKELVTGMGFSCVTAFEGPELHMGGITITKVPARHGDNLETVAYLGESSGYVLQGEDKTLYLAGDTVYFDGMAQTIDTYHPDVNDVEIICKKAPNATIIATHLDSVNHALLSSDDVRAFAARKKLTQLHVPANGEWIILP